ncbi:methyltransferase [Angomonas deanei]|nr:methyltransferase [Angomonas deanei]|eukprot:EPY38952.1 methyltransferase [Angomonas deanei]
MIFDRFYLQEGEGPNDRAMWFQAGLEVEWLEEWAEQKVRADMKREGPTEANRTIPYTDRIRQEVKKAVIQRHDLYKPLAYIIGNQPFFSCEIECVPPLLCPRPETELWTHWVVQTVLKSAADHDKPIRVLDMCCGTGCIGVAIAKNCPQAEVVAVDILEKAVEVSNRNARRNGIPEARYQAKQSDMFDLFLEKESPTDGKRKVRPEYEGTFDVLVSNPPYILPDQYVDLPISVTHWESKLALVGDDAREHKQYTYFQELTDYGSSLLKKRVDRDVKLGILPNIFIEIGLQGHVVASIMERSGLFTDVLMHQDYAGQERWISANSSH